MACGLWLQCAVSCLLAPVVLDTTASSMTPPQWVALDLNWGIWFYFNHCGPELQSMRHFKSSPWFTLLFHYTEVLRRHPVARHYRNYLFFQLVDKMPFPLPEFFRRIWRAPPLSVSGRGLIESQRQSDLLKLTAAESFLVTLKSPSLGESTGNSLWVLTGSFGWIAGLTRACSCPWGRRLVVGLQGHLHEEPFSTYDWWLIELSLNSGAARVDLIELN